MSKGKKTGGRDFVKGQVTNPKGAPRISEDLKKFRKLTPTMVAEMISRFAAHNREQLQAALRNPDASILELMFGKAIEQALKTGDPKYTNMILDRVVGKVTDKIEHKLPKPTVVKLFGEDATIVLGSQRTEEEPE